MNIDLPDDLLHFLNEGQILKYDTSKSNIGPITLKNSADVTLSVITTFPGCQSIIDDPYENIDGLYQIEVYDLVANSEYYCPEGLLCWIVALEQYGCVDPEHGDIITFPDVTWGDIAANPAIYLDAQWADEEVGQRILPWLHFVFQLNEDDTKLTPYGSLCPIHNVPVTVREIQKSTLLDILQQLAIDDWLQCCSSEFPCPGLSVSEDELLACSFCREAEEAWGRNINEAIVAVDVSPYIPGWVKCPCCDKRFSVTDSNVFESGFHLPCGQKINVVP